ncbi:hypothetical protein BDD43_0124 [Mucilaginibacter gracilis]|uniref:Uncharacterized protein n=1 Tax=Mucilaginibacter gracilis TaxID=423350 RepID=A0A495ITD0_9SPHI|nr:hypothetical protein [Mucilaginibacter gracilis]RKR80035.1 hypothetical protein BDD43_0124 [Mucilaginibacter gracilis]
MSIDKFTPGIDDDSLESDESINNELSSKDEPQNLNYNEEENSFELDVKSDDPDYDHADPYNSAVKDGGDSISTYDEANPLAVDEYVTNEALQDDVTNLGMHIDNKGQSVEVDAVDKILSHTAEDDRDDLDEEGYPKNDEPMK